MDVDREIAHLCDDIYDRDISFQYVYEVFFRIFTSLHNRSGELANPRVAIERIAEILVNVPDVSRNVMQYRYIVRNVERYIGWYNLGASEEMSRILEMVIGNDEQHLSILQTINTMISYAFFTEEDYERIQRVVQNHLHYFEDHGRSRIYDISVNMPVINIITNMDNIAYRLSFGLYVSYLLDQLSHFECMTANRIEQITNALLNVGNMHQIDDLNQDSPLVTYFIHHATFERTLRSMIRQALTIPLYEAYTLLFVLRIFDGLPLFIHRIYRADDDLVIPDSMIIRILLRLIYQNIQSNPQVPYPVHRLRSEFIRLLNHTMNNPWVAYHPRIEFDIRRLNEMVPSMSVVDIQEVIDRFEEPVESVPMIALGPDPHLDQHNIAGEIQIYDEEDVAANQSSPESQDDEQMDDQDDFSDVPDDARRVAVDAPPRDPTVEWCEITEDEPEVEVPIPAEELGMPCKLTIRNFIEGIHMTSPHTHDPLRAPAIIPSGYTFNLETLEHALESNPARCPVTRRIFYASEIRPNRIVYDILQVIQNFEGSEEELQEAVCHLLRCHASGQPLLDPVVGIDGYTYNSNTVPSMYEGHVYQRLNRFHFGIVYRNRWVELLMCICNFDELAQRHPSIWRSCR
jgi:hypothetical protein